MQEVLLANVARDKGALKRVIKGHVQFKNVSLTIDGKQILDNISFEIKPNTKTAIIGPTASGKTQIFNLLIGLIKPDHGEILIDGEYIENYDKESLYNQVATVFQESIIFNTNIKENIEYKIPFD